MMDYLDGALSDSDKELFMQFLDRNPDLKKELEGLDKTILVPANDTFNAKSRLIKTEADEFEMPYEDYIAIKEIEGELNAEEILWKKSVANKEDACSLSQAYQHTILQKDQNIKFPAKDTIKRVSLIPVFSVATFKKVSVAATIAIVLSIATLPFLKESANDIQSVAVNDTPSAIVVPTQKNIEKAKKTSVEESTALKDSITNKNERRQHIQENNSTVSDFKERERDEPIEPIFAKSPQIETTGLKLNAYELGLNAMMPLVIAHNLEEQEKYYLAMERQIQIESERLSKSAWAISSGVKVINFLSGSKAKVKKFVNENGDMVAYQLKSETISVSRKIKSLPVTN